MDADVALELAVIDFILLLDFTGILCPEQVAVQRSNNQGCFRHRRISSLKIAGHGGAPLPCPRFHATRVVNPSSRLTSAIQHVLIVRPVLPRTHSIISLYVGIPPSLHCPRFPLSDDAAFANPFGKLRGTFKHDHPPSRVPRHRMRIA